MKKLLFILSIFGTTFLVKAQNVGQTGDTLLNYVDINGLKQGTWQKNYSNGKLRYKAYFVNDKPVGDLYRYDSYGDMEAHLIYDKNGEHATAVFFHRSGDTAATGGYIGKVKDGIWKYYDEKGIFYLQESFKAGVKDGKFLNITSEGNIMEEVNYQDGIKHGPWIKHFPEGPLMFECNMVNGKIEGMTKTYYKSGVINKEGKFINDMMDGPWKIYDENGNLVKVYQYKNGYCEEAQREKEQMLDELERNKDQYVEPDGNNDIDWLRSVTE